MQNSSKKGFTLIEMSLVLLVIGILAGIVLRNIGGQSSVSRDTKRVGDLKIVANYLATHMVKFGYYPTSSDWDDLETVLKNAKIAEKLPRDPAGKTYYYYYCTDLVDLLENASTTDINHFVLKAKLDQKFSVAPRLYEGAATSFPTDWKCTSSPSCSPDNSEYCLAQ